MLYLTLLYVLRFQATFLRRRASAWSRSSISAISTRRSTPRMSPGDTIAIELRDAAGRDVCGRIEQRVVQR